SPRTATDPHLDGDWLVHPPCRRVQSSSAPLARADSRSSPEIHVRIATARASSSAVSDRRRCGAHPVLIMPLGKVSAWVTVGRASRQGYRLITRSHVGDLLRANLIMAGKATEGAFL